MELDTNSHYIVHILYKLLFTCSINNTKLTWNRAFKLYHYYIILDFVCFSKNEHVLILGIDKFL